MVTGGSVDGLISGMSTSAVISQLMQVEAAPQTSLKSKVSAQQKVVTSYQSINTKMSALLTAAKALNDPVAWKGATATSSSDAVVATTTASGSSQSGSLTFSVKKLASAHSLVYGGRVAETTDSVMSGSSFDITINGQTKTVTPADTSLKGVVDAINKTADLGVKATAIQAAPGQYTLQLTATTTGTGSTFTVSGLDGLGADAIATQGDNAVLSVGTTNPFEVSSSTNTFKGLLDGLTVTASKVQAPTDPPITVTVASDTEGIAAKVQAMVDAANATLSEIATQTKSKSGGIAGGPLAGNSSMQSLATTVLSTVSGGAGTLGSLKDVGVELTRDGQLSFNKTTFLAALNADPVKTQSYFNGTTDIDGDGVKDGFADKMVSVADKATQTNTGTLARFITSGNDAITELNDRISDWDVRLAARQQTLQRQFTAMETALGKLRNQSSWLAGQLSSLG
ncbi:flagellar filament capping protein FliD [Dactylosporangium roseum]|uniref:Flagellar hook-associated protein 2 n=1 Tax=Dactylosporangium roseum TaxID=47989 RepID=A0ABY5Z0Q7_9ACTN|nr:flagellar filament capping protein FliD [Dactylosporangium roseum]UWZ35600.1 flagellar filament capping protein FliD [Dactylosporangium roseum]